MTAQRSLLAILGATLFVTCVGCAGGDDIAKVEGTVTMDNQPLPNATVVFIGGQGRPAAGITDENGRYQLNFRGEQKGAIPGMNRVQITTAQGPGETMDGQPVAAVMELVPTKYNVESTLQFEVEPGKVNVADFDLDSQGTVIQSEDD